jgi:hypothetical protein
LACTRDNPAFDGDEAAGDGESGTGAESDETTQGDGTTDATDTEASSDASDATDESTTEPVTDLPGDVCEGELRGGLALKFADPSYFNGFCPDELEMHGMLHYDANLQSLVLNRCMGDDLLCQGECGYELHPLALDIEIDAFAGTCVSVQASKPLGNDEDLCAWSTISMFPSGNVNTPLAVAVTAGAEPVDVAKAALGNYPSLVQKAMCECESFEIADACCTESDVQVLFFDFELPGPTFVAPGESAMIELAASPYAYEFQAVQAQRVGDCGTIAGIDVSWALWAKF